MKPSPLVIPERTNGVLKVSPRSAFKVYKQRSLFKQIKLDNSAFKTNEDENFRVTLNNEELTPFESQLYIHTLKIVCVNENIKIKNY
jgi:hypothetical protein